MGRRKGRDVHGIVLLDKPVNMSSNAALQTVKRLYQARKAGHTGSLDPLASGLLPVCLGEATKLAGFLLDQDKRYRVLCKLGTTTNTGDAEGDVLEVRPVGDIVKTRLEAVLARFKGEIEQVPPMFSALKHQGQPLYKLARRGVEVERKARRVVIYEIKQLRHEGELLEIEIACSKGTYIRTLTEDIGTALGCGAHVAALRRIGVGDFDECRMVNLAQLQTLAEQYPPQLDSLLLPMQTALAHWPDVRLSDDATYFLKRGQAVFVPHVPKCEQVTLYASGEHFLGIGRVLPDGRVAPKRLVNID